ncbi:polysaccharide deacetylase family protein [Streptantibioticus rubrisoli]|uniref:Polysaccharide deacetylase family protein n=1 Tax=Streptantibioticus rubrisoli TaxID=1387313 RepID=A0ABT1PDZ2_9ACTN|nr:polysaccharide deacetylase family protein [Streptantibioticus rubrisoli]MCQ4043587.1 polysaccharide deacetylase family protein [Streptantibioticus rubrisoli]
MTVVTSVVTGCSGAAHAPAQGTASTSRSAPAPKPAPSRVADVDCQRARCLALSYDDGPSPYTAPLLRVLEGRHVPATFFLIGRQVRERPRDVLREYRDGDAIGDHTVSHPDLTRITSARIRYQITAAARQIAAVDGVRPTMLRPPYGSEDARVRAVARAAGVSVVLWNDDPRDWKHHDAPLIERRVLKQARSGGIVDLHDRYAATIAATPRIIDALRARGYTLVTIPQLFAGVGGMHPGAVYSHGP